MNLLIATNNPGKFSEIQEILKEIPYKLISLKKLDIFAEPEETGLTHEENAILKAKHFFKLAEIPTIGEDSGIWIEALHGELGVTTRRWGAGEYASDEEWLEHFMERMKNETNRNAKFVSVAAFYDGNQIVTFHGETSGIITEQIESPLKSGIPLSSVFKANGCDKVYAALSEEEKNKNSHRGKAFMQMRDWLIKNHVK